MALEGELNFNTVPALLAKAESLVKAGSLDLAKVGHADSAGVALLLELTRRARAAGLTLDFANPPPQLRGLISFFGLTEALSLSELP